MQLSEDEFIEEYAKYCGYFLRSVLFPYEYELTCFSCRCHVIKRKHELFKIQRKRINFTNRLK